MELKELAKLIKKAKTISRDWEDCYSALEAAEDMCPWDEEDDPEMYQDHCEDCDELRWEIAKLEARGRLLFEEIFKVISEDDLKELKGGKALWRWWNTIK